MSRHPGFERTFVGIPSFKETQLFFRMRGECRYKRRKKIRSYISYTTILYFSGRNTTTRHVFVSVFFKIAWLKCLFKAPQKIRSQIHEVPTIFSNPTHGGFIQALWPAFPAATPQGVILGMIMPFFDSCKCCSSLKSLIHFISGRSIMAFYNPSTFMTYKIKAHRDFHAGKTSIYRVITIFVKKT